ncbi:hypothetical protein R1flu_020715 [Riccia fluitans]|uniref:Uncharacterized protein n=1 Tax=Riccia fluitans TaxID=41844 RepID=A0ABD1ZMR6_9MARC
MKISRTPETRAECNTLAKAKKLARGTLANTHRLDRDVEEEDEEEGRKKEDPKGKRKRKSPPLPKAPRKKRSSKK